VDLIAGQSAKSPLIHYVSRLVPDLDLPPEGKGTRCRMGPGSSCLAFVREPFMQIRGMSGRSTRQCLSTSCASAADFSRFSGTNNMAHASY
jgi:hypothetical protein